MLPVVTQHSYIAAFVNKAISHERKCCYTEYQHGCDWGLRPQVRFKAPSWMKAQGQEPPEKAAVGSVRF